MKFDISGFTHVGTKRRLNQDNILINGKILNEGLIMLPDENECFCFVADGVGGSKRGDFASRFVLEGILAEKNTLFEHAEITLQNLNTRLIQETKSDPTMSGCASTLSGLIANKLTFKIFHAGDSQIWLLRNDLFFKISNDQVVNEDEDNSPITSYFGGVENYLILDNKINVTDCLNNDIFLICSDGLFKSIDKKIVKSILNSDKELYIKNIKILDNTLLKGAPDNVSSILIHRKQ